MSCLVKRLMKSFVQSILLLLFCRTLEMEASPPRRRRRLNDPVTNPQGNVEHFRVKNRPCCFCQLNLDVTNFENHLQGSVHCRRLYMSWLKVSSVEGILLKTFDCIFCQARCYKLTNHLINAPDCRNRYFQRLDVDNLK